MKTFSLLVLVVSASLSFAGEVDPQAFTLAGTWKGKALARIPHVETGEMPKMYSCQELIATITPAEGACDPDFDWRVEGGKPYKISMSCTDPNLSEAGRAIFQFTAKACEVLERAETRKDGGKSDFRTLSIPDFKPNQSNDFKQETWTLGAEIEDGKPSFSLNRYQSGGGNETWTTDFRLTKP